MSTSLKELAGWFEEGREQKASHMIVVCDTFDHEDYPVYAFGPEDCWGKYRSHDGVNMQRIMEVYDLNLAWSKQTDGHVMNMPAVNGSPQSKRGK